MIRNCLIRCTKIKLLVQNLFHPIIVGNIKEINEIQILLNHIPSSFQNLKHILQNFFNGKNLNTLHVVFLVQVCVAKQ